MADQQKWEGLQSVGVVEAVRQAGEQHTTVERRYYLSSLGLDAARFGVHPNTVLGSNCLNFGVGGKSF